MKEVKRFRFKNKKGFVRMSDEKSLNNSSDRKLGHTSVIRLFTIVQSALYKNFPLHKNQT